jgi:hypothetical protein
MNKRLGWSLRQLRCPRREGDSVLHQFYPYRQVRVSKLWPGRQIPIFFRHYFVASNYLPRCSDFNLSLISAKVCSTKSLPSRNTSVSWSV